MGQNNRYKSLAKVIQAFVDKNTWSQADLARKVGIGTPALRKLLVELEQSGMKLHQDSEPPQAYWSVEKTWFPGGILLADADYPTLLRAVFELPETRARHSLLGKLLGRNASPGAADRVSSRESSDGEDLYYDVVQEALLKSQALKIRYLSQSRGSEGWRLVSPQKLVAQPHPRLLAWCHQAHELRWFRLDNVLQASISATEKFIVAVASLISRVLNESVDGFHAPKSEGTKQLAFSVRYPEANWVKKNLLSSMRVDERGSTAEVLRIACGSGGGPVVARFVVGLGEAARAEGPVLTALVMMLAEGALGRHAKENKRAGKRADGVNAAGKGQG